jgi:hypothetical protein
MIRVMAIRVGPPGRGRARAGSGGKGDAGERRRAFTPKFSDAKRNFSARHHSAGLLVLERGGELTVYRRGTASDLGASGRKN